MASQPPLTVSDFASALDVSRETLDRLEIYETMLRQWQKTINLVGRRTLDDVWRRHFLDSGQLCRLLGGAKTVADIGSGGGFPGLVIAIMTGGAVTLVEADNRKAAFLREVSRATGANTKVIAGRAEDTQAIPAEAVTARALAPLSKLLALAEPWVRPGGQCFFMKGAAVADELTDAKKFWDIRFDLVPSLSDPSGAILCVKEFHHV
ncbi:MAG: 16S rRNA (guanine(527)-N(7))-methyltransferase RsmG [Alphaproteobacteria bacterium]|nr:16S rRNA (guanine(527)-N(7))-methyltransferase RsmG [Alphaproteobacteria bacterium]